LDRRPLATPAIAPSGRAQLASDLATSIRRVPGCPPRGDVSDGAALADAPVSSYSHSWADYRRAGSDRKLCYHGPYGPWYAG
jgi:hypothetical protein